VSQSQFSAEIYNVVEQAVGVAVPQGSWPPPCRPCSN